jgi:purine-binding chemotaxis protein CheW
VQTDVADQKVVIFRVGREEYAVSITAVKEVIPWVQPTPVPDVPAVVEGVVDLRGAVIPIIDMGRLLGSARQHDNAGSRIIVMEVGGQQAGFVVDNVTEVHTLVPGSIVPPSPVLRMTRADSGQVVSGILNMGENRLIVLIDPARILSAAQVA